MISEQTSIIPASRFSNRAYNYQQYRPAYLTEIRTFLEEHLALHQGDSIVDVGSGTGRFAELFLRNGYAVTAVEPNDEMREAAEKKLCSYRQFTSVAGTAEDTGLMPDSANLITVAQAFHWMDIEAARKEFSKILTPNGKVILVWTVRKTGTPFLHAYDQLKNQFRGKDMASLINEYDIQSFYAPAKARQHSFLHSSWIDFDGLKGLLLSSSGIPLPGQAQYDTMISALVQLFVACNRNGFVEMEYETKLYWSE